MPSPKCEPIVSFFLEMESLLISRALHQGDTTELENLPASAWTAYNLTKG